MAGQPDADRRLFLIDIGNLDQKDRPQEFSDKRGRYFYVQPPNTTDIADREPLGFPTPDPNNKDHKAFFSQAFVNLLLATGHDRSVPIYVVLTMRSDYLGPCALFPGLPEALNDAQYLCPRLTRDQLAEAIEGPASVFGSEVEQALVTQIVNDAGANSDQLPLVQHVLARMWHVN